MNAISLEDQDEEYIVYERDDMKSIPMPSNKDSIAEAYNLITKIDSTHRLMFGGYIVILILAVICIILISVGLSKQEIRTICHSFAIISCLCILAVSYVANRDVLERSRVFDRIYVLYGPKQDTKQLNSV